MEPLFPNCLSYPIFCINLTAFYAPKCFTQHQNIGYYWQLLAVLFNGNVTVVAHKSLLDKILLDRDNIMFDEMLNKSGEICKRITQ